MTGLKNDERNNLKIEKKIKRNQKAITKLINNKNQDLFIYLHIRP
jgi:hypothetical protein